VLDSITGDLNTMSSALFKRSISVIVLLFIQSGLQARPAYTFWNNIHLKQNNQWYVKQNNQYLRIDFNNIYIVFKDQFNKKDRDSLLAELHCVVQKTDSRKEYKIKIASSTEFFYFLRQVTYNNNIERVSIKTAGNDRLVDSLVAEIRIGDKLFIEKDSEWYMSQAGQLYEVVRDLISLRFKKEIREGQQQLFIEQNHFQVIRKNRLEIYDMHVLSQRHAIFHFIQLYQYPLLEFVEVNTKGSY
jgi:hypothetical protein